MFFRLNFRLSRSLPAALQSTSICTKFFHDIRAEYSVKAAEYYAQRSEYSVIARIKSTSEFCALPNILTL